MGYLWAAAIPLAEVVDAEIRRRILYGHVIGPDATTIFLNDIDPLLGALGSAGASATTGPPKGAAPLHWNVKGWVVRVYCRVCGGGAKRPTDQLTGSGLTVVGEAEKVPVATN